MTVHAGRSHAEVVGRAWAAVLAIPVFFLLAFALGYVVYDVLGYAPEDNDAPLWVDLAAALASLVVALAPCAAAVVLGRRASRGGDRWALGPLVIGVGAGLAITVLTVVTTAADALR